MMQPAYVSSQQFSMAHRGLVGYAPDSATLLVQVSDLNPPDLQAAQLL